MFFFAGQSLGVEFRACAFSGPGNPMVHLVSGRYSFNQCDFETSTINRATRRVRRGVDTADTNGVDIFIDAPPALVAMVSPPGDPIRSDVGYTIACFTARDVVSKSPQFLTTFSTEPTTGSSQAATVLQNVRHVPANGNGRPSVLWDGAGGTPLCQLVVMGCDLPTWLGGNPVRVTNRLRAPIFDMGNKVRNGARNAVVFGFDPSMSPSPSLVHRMPRVAIR